MKIEYRLLQAFVAPLGLAAIFIGSMIVATGVLSTLHFFESTYAVLFSKATVLEPITVTPTIDNEFRFYAVLWISYGVLALWVSRRIEAQIRVVPYILGVFFIGGIARLVSIYSVGLPHPLFIFLMYIEIAVPVIGGIVYLKVTRRGLGVT